MHAGTQAGKYAGKYHVGYNGQTSRKRGAHNAARPPLRRLSACLPAHPPTHYRFDFAARIVAVDSGT
jgi:hypothetical protein